MTDYSNINFPHIIDVVVSAPKFIYIYLSLFANIIRPLLLKITLSILLPLLYLNIYKFLVIAIVAYNIKFHLKLLRFLKRKEIPM